MRRQIQEIPDWREQVDATLGDFVGHAWMPAVEQPDVATRVAREHRDRGVLISLGVLAAEVVLEGTVATAQQPEVPPPPPSRMLPECRRFRGGRYDEVDI